MKGEWPGLVGASMAPDDLKHGFCAEHPVEEHYFAATLVYVRCAIHGAEIDHKDLVVGVWVVPPSDDSSLFLGLVIRSHGDGLEPGHSEYANHETLLDPWRININKHLLILHSDIPPCQIKSSGHGRTLSAQPVQAVRRTVRRESTWIWRCLHEKEAQSTVGIIAHQVVNHFGTNLLLRFHQIRVLDRLYRQFQVVNGGIGEWFLWIEKPLVPPIKGCEDTFLMLSNVEL